MELLVNQTAEIYKGYCVWKEGINQNSVFEDITKSIFKKRWYKQYTFLFVSETIITD